MTNWETFFLVAITMALLLGPFAIMIIALLRSSKETYQVVYKTESFNNPWLQYFISLDIFFACLFTFMGCVMVKAIFTIRSNSTSIPDWAVYLLLSLFALLMFIFAGYIFILSINHWKYTKNVIITFNPKERTILIENSFIKYDIGEGDIESANVFSNEKRTIFLFYKLKIRNKPDLILTGATRGVFGIFEFFKKIPIQSHKLLFPIIT